MSKYLSYLLRHGAVKEGLDIDKEGFVKVTELLEFLINNKSDIITMEQIKQIVEDVKFEREGINRATLEKIKTKINIKTIKLTEKGEERGSAGAALAIGMISALMIYIFISLV